MRSLQLKHEFEIEVEKKAKKCLQQLKDSLENELSISKQEVMALKSTVAKMTADSLGITTELQATKVGLVLCIVFSRYNTRLLSHCLFCLSFPFALKELAHGVLSYFGQLATYKRGLTRPYKPRT